MALWIEMLDSDLGNRVRALIRRGCSFVWRNRESGEAFVEAFEGNGCWWEVWHLGKLLTFSGPHRYPGSHESLRAMLVMFLPTTEYFMRTRR